MAKMDMRTWLGHTGTKLLLVITLFLAAEVVILLVRQERNSVFKPKVTPAPLEAGHKISEVEGTDLNNLTQKINLSSASKLLFVFSSTCPACERNFANWKNIEAKVGRENILYLSADAISETSKKYMVDKGIEGRSMFFANEKEKMKLKIHRIPQTIYVNRGEVKAAYVGTLSSDQIESLKTLN